jgi:hypothetical protein
VHDTVPAVDLCQRCGRFLCGDCVELVEEEVYCVECAPKVKLGASMLARAALIMAFVAWAVAAGSVLNLRTAIFLWAFIVVPVPTALAALVVALIEWRRLKTGLSPARGRRWVIGALALAVPLLFLWGALFLYGLNAVMNAEHSG